MPNPGKNKRKATSNGGTGYGGQNGDTKRLVAGRQKAEQASLREDSEKIILLKKYLSEIQSKLSCAHDWDGVDSLVSNDMRKQISEILAGVFRNQVPTDWDSRKDLYNTAFNLCRAIASDARLGILFGCKDNREEVLFWLLDFGRQAEQILKREAGSASQAEGDLLLGTQVVEVADAALRISKLCQAGKPEAELSVVSLSECYQEELGPLRFETVGEMPNHFFLKKYPSAPSNMNSRNLFKELTAYATALPVEYGSSCFCRVVDSRLDMLRVMITGPDGTPYANGVFFFDINIPAAYPQVAPRVQFLTTGGGKMRFNPNLYNCGKVCLSLLGTWTGPGWVSGQSTLLQVLISIQSLILVPDPYFNEPGWESQRGTPKGKENSTKYNRNIRLYTLNAALESHLHSILQKNNPYPEFESAVIKHFLKKRSLIEKDLRSWAAEDASVSKRVANVCSLLAQLANREKGSKKAASRAVHASASVSVVKKSCQKSNELIILDDSDDDTKDDVNDSAKTIKENELVGIDDLNDGIQKEASTKRTKLGSSKKNNLYTDDEVVDLT